MMTTTTAWLLGCTIASLQAPQSVLELEAPAEVPVSDDTPTSPIRFVLANTYGLNFGLAPIPSGEAALFLGGSLPVRIWYPAHWVALGYRGAIAGGSADAPGFASSSSMFVHRHHLSILGAAGPRGRFAYGVDVGVVFPVPQRGAPGLEAEGRFGYLFGPARRKNQGIVGAQLRISGGVEYGPWPQVGAFIGLVHAPVARGAGRSTVPSNGLGLLVPGALLATSGVLTAVTSGIALAAQGNGSSQELWSYTGPYAAVAVALGVPMLAVGSVRLRDYRAYRMRMGAGLAIDF
jgi:hypothetical protein